MSTTETKPTSDTVAVAKPSINISLDYLVPTLSAIGAGIIHHICNKKEKLTYVDVLLIISPSLPVLLGVVIKIIAFMINWIANGTQNMNLGFLGTFIQKINSYMNFKQKVDNTHSFDNEGRIIFHKYTVDIDISKKMTEWQKEGYYVYFYDDEFPSLCLHIIEKITKTSLILLEKPPKGHKFVNFYNEFVINDEKVFFYAKHMKDNKYQLYIASKNKELIHYRPIYTHLFPSKYTENTSYYRISRIYNEYREELLHTIQMYKEKSMSRRKVCMNFCFAGPPGTSKTYAARAIAKELGREIFEINLSKIVFEEEFFELFKEENIKKYVYLLDEIDLMCPSREFDDKLIKSAEETRLTTFGVTTCSSTKSIATENESETSSLTEEDGYGNVNKQLLHKINLLQEDMRKLHEKMEKTLSFQEWLKSYLTHFCQISMEFLYLIVCKSSNTNLKEIVETNFLEGYKNNFFTESNGITRIKPNFIEEKVISFFYLNTGLTNSTSNNSSFESKSQNKTPFTLRKLLNFISGGNTHDDLVIIATTNRPEKLDPALIRPGRLRLVEFKNLRKVDAVAMLLENYPEQRIAIECGLDEIGYEDYMSNGALLEAVMSSTSTLEKTLQTFQRELCNH